MDDMLRELYQEVILDHGKNPHNFRHPEDATCEAHGNNPLCGDKLTVYLRLGERQEGEDHQLIEDAAFEGRGCAISIASASMMTDIVRGKTTAQAEQLFGRFHKMCTDGEDMTVADEFADEIEKLQVLSGVNQFPMRVKCATLAWHTMNEAASGGGEASSE
jgi:nitrogen fixation NifU-like protein